LHETIHGIAHTIADQPVEVMPGVPETLDYLAARGHHLILMTKGSITEQSGKVERSGLKDFFAAVEIVVEKDRPTYCSVVEKYALNSERTWMVGNSPKSDVNPALAAGLNAVFVPHDQTWVLEHEEVASPMDASRRLLVVEKFAELQRHF
jgi:putative hydrolase of the HAD superfamily